MQKNNHKILDLLKEGFKTYVYLEDEEIRKVFAKNADEEGITFGDGIKVSKKELSDIVALKEDKTICFVGTIGHMAFYDEGHSLVPVYRVDYKKYISGEEDFIYKVTEEDKKKASIGGFNRSGNYFYV